MKQQDGADDKFSLKNILYIFGAVAFFCIFFKVMFFVVSDIKMDPIFYAILYRPLYLLRGDSIYFPFYIYLVWMVCGFGILLYLAFNILYKSHDFWLSYVLAFLFVAGAVVMAKESVSDLLMVMKNEYKTDVAFISDVRTRKVPTNRGRPVEYVLTAMSLKNDDNLGRIKMDIYQYRELSEFKEKNGDVSRLKIYYLPNTRRLLKYEVIE